MSIKLIDIDCIKPLPHYGLPRRFAYRIINITTPRKDEV